MAGCTSDGSPWQAHLVDPLGVQVLDADEGAKALHGHIRRGSWRPLFQPTRTMAALEMQVKISAPDQGSKRSAIGCLEEPDFAWHPNYPPDFVDLTMWALGRKQCSDGPSRY